MITVFLRTVIIYLLLMLSVRLMGKRQIGELDISDLIATLLLSEIATLPITDTSIPVMHSVIPILTLVVFEVCASYLLTRFPAIKSIMSARPAILINKGIPDRRAMLDARVSVDELISELRQKGICELDEVEYAILEQNGKITVIQKASCKPPTAEQMGLSPKESGIAHIVVCEGRINKNSLDRLGIRQKDILKKLKKAKTPLKEVYIMTLNDSLKECIITKQGKKEDCK